MKKAWLAVLLSFVVPGLGHLYLGKVKKGALLVGIYIISVFLTAVIIGLVPLIGVVIYAMIDSYKITYIVNEETHKNTVNF